MEVLGPPGAGKTTVLEAVSRLSPMVRPVRGYSALRYVPAYLQAALCVAPLLRAGTRDTPDVRKSANWMIRLQASTKVLQAERARGGPVVLFDQGPAYTLVRLHPRSDAPADRYRDWWTRSVDRWATLLDVLVVLDASDEVLLARIRSRGKEHSVKHVAPAQAVQALTAYRTQCQSVAGRLAAGGHGPRILCLDTAVAEPAALAQTVLAALAVDDRPRSPSP